jgi:ABC-type glycerol-3-phosphate transport system substrate-binding protein
MTDNSHSPEKLSRRVFLRGGLATVTAVSFMPLLAACQPVPGNPAGGADSDAAGTENIEMLAFWWSDSPRDAKVLTDTFTAFEERHPGVKITFDDTGAQHLEKLMTNMAAGTPPDIFAVHTAWMVQVAAAGQLVDWTPFPGAAGLLHLPWRLLCPALLLRAKLYLVQRRHLPREGGKDPVGT